MRHAKIYMVAVVLFSCAIHVTAYADKSIQNHISEKDIFHVLFAGLAIQGKNLDGPLLRFSQTNEDDVLKFLKQFPVGANRIVNRLSFEKTYRFIQSFYGKYFIVYSLGNETNQWKGRLYKMAFNITFPNKEIPEDETKVFRKLTQTYGDYTKIEKFQYGDGGFANNINLYIWQFPNIVVTYRSIYSPQERKTAVVVNYWDSRFYNTYPYYAH